MRHSPEAVIERLREDTEGEAVLYPNLEEALVGICRRFGQQPVALYDYRKCIEILKRDQKSGGLHEGLSEDEAHFMAVEHFEYNVLGGWVGEYTPSFLYGPEYD